MAGQDLFEYVCDRVIGRLVERVPGTTDEAERAWFDQMLEDWIRAQHPSSADDCLDDAQRDLARPSVLRGSDYTPRNRLSHEKPSGIQIHVRPPEPEQLTEP